MEMAFVKPSAQICMEADIRKIPLSRSDGDQRMIENAVKYEFGG
jgi:hypothetical protein